MESLSEIKRRFDWWLKHRLTLSPAPRRRYAALTTTLHAMDEAAQSRWIALAQRYPAVAQHLENCDKVGLLESLYVLDILDSYMPMQPPPGRCLDIGARNWAYLPGLVGYSPRAWDGVELDAHQRYWDLTTRRAHGEAMARDFDDCRYLSSSVMDLAGPYSLITWFLPFVTEAPLRRWGLPRCYFQPEDLLNHAWGMLAPGGVLFIANQGEEEREAQRTLFVRQHIAAHNVGLMESAFSPYQQSRSCWWAVKAK